MSDANLDGPQVKRPPLEAPGDQSASPDGDLAAEVTALAGLLGRRRLMLWSGCGERAGPAL